jgi:hypothetical protein
MQIKKDILFSLLLMIVAACLLIAAKSTPVKPARPDMHCAGLKCENKEDGHRHVSPWNFLTQGVLHLSA